MMNAFLIFLAGLYLLAVLRFRIVWLEHFMQDTDAYLNERLYSLIVITVASIFWIVVVPIAYLELLEKQQKQNISITIVSRAGSTDHSCPRRKSMH